MTHCDIPGNPADLSTAYLLYRVMFLPSPEITQIMGSYHTACKNSSTSASTPAHFEPQAVALYWRL